LVEYSISHPVEPITFAYGLANATKNIQVELKNILNGYKIENQKRFIPKLFIKLAGQMELEAHAWLLVVESDPKDRINVKVTLINPAGSRADPWNKKLEKEYLKTVREILPCSTVIQNSVWQQQDEWSCAWHALMNIILLSQIDDVQEFVRQNRLPIRTTESIEAFRMDMYTQYVGPALTYIHSFFPDMDAFQRFRDDLIAKGKLAKAK
jgi:hypothetical protein